MTDCHHHQGHHAPSESRRLIWALVVISGFMVVEIIGGLLSGSLALLADATHMFTDAGALALAASAQVLSRRPPDDRLHFGYRRAQVLAAFVNGVLMAVLLVWIIVEAVTRFLEPVPIAAPMMLWVAIAGLLANILAFVILHKPGEQNVNIRGALLHVMGDLLGSVAAIAAAIVILLTGWLRIDPLLSIFVALLIGVSALRLLRETGHILLEGAPNDLDVKHLSKALQSASPVIQDVHLIKVWQITPEQTSLTLHASVASSDEADAAMRAIKDYLAKHTTISISTIQIDVGGACPDAEDDAIGISAANNVATGDTTTALESKTIAAAKA